MRKRYTFGSIQDVVDHFAPISGRKLPELQAMCADLFGAMGLKARLRPRADAYGNRLELSFAGESGFADCLCMRGKERVTRQYVRQLVQDNPNCKPSHIICVTTTDFTSDARAYCQAAGLRAVGCIQLIGLLKKHDFILEKHVEEIEPDVTEVAKDIREHVEEQEDAPVEERGPAIVPKSPLAARASVQGRRPKSQGFDARAYMASLGRKNSP